MSDLCADPACAQIREWYLADEVKLAQIHKLLDHYADYIPSGARVITDIHRILDGEPQP